MLRSTTTSLGAIALALGGTSVLCASDSPDRIVKASAKAAKQAAKALDDHQTDGAVIAAERAVALSPRDAAYRLLLGRSYLQAGRFTAASEAFADTLQLDAGNGRAALNLALTQIARGEWPMAHQTLDRYAGVIPAADRGLALALTGDTAGAVTLLTQVARSPQTNAKVRQNLALAYAMAGQWDIARVIAAADISPADVDGRMQQWAAFVQPHAAADQVASLLGVQPVADSGQPVGLALNTPAVTPTAPGVMVTQEVPPAVSAPSPAPVAVASIAPARPKLVFAAPKEVVQPLPAAMIARPAVAFKTPLRPATVAKGFAPAPGRWYVQLGAFANAQEAKSAWARATHRYAGFGGQVPQGARIKVANATSYRLSVGGFTRAAATSACRQYRLKGGACFVRLGLGDRMAAWVAPGRQVAMR